jgi:hypothetical protein
MAENSEGMLLAQPWTVGNIPDVYFKGGIDKLGKLLVVSRGTTKWMHYLQHMIGMKATRVDTFEPKNHEINELRYYITPVEDSSTTNAANTQLKVTNYDGLATVKPNDVLVVSNLWYEPSNTTHYSNTFGLNGGEYYIQNESVYVLSIDANDAAGTGYTYINLRRGYNSEFAGSGWNNTTAALHAAPSGPPAILSGTKVFRAGNAFAHGTGYPTGEFAMPSVNGNYLQEMKWALEITMEAELEKTFLDDAGYTPMSLQTMLKTAQFMKDYEKWFFTSPKTKTSSAYGNPLYTSGGLLAHLKKDVDHVIDYTRGGQVQTINYMDINTMGDTVFKVGGGTTKTMVCGNSLLTRLQNSFYNKFLFMDAEKSNAFNIPVGKLITGSGELNIVSTYTLDEFGFTDKAMIIDFSAPTIEKTVFNGVQKLANGSTVNADFDLYVEDNIQLPGEKVHKKGMMTIGGFQFRGATYHSVVTGFPTAVAKYSTESAI